MGLGHWLSEAVASVSESLTGRKRKAPDGRLDEENEDLGLPPAPPLPSIDRPVVKPSQHLPSNRAPQRLDFSSPAMNGPQRGTGQWPPLGAAGQEQQKANPSHPIRLLALPARRLDDMLGVAAGTYTRGQQDMQAGSAAAAAGLDGVVDGQPFARHFAPPRVSTPLRGGSTPDLLRVRRQLVTVMCRGGCISALRPLSRVSLRRCSMVTCLPARMCCAGHSACA